VISTRSFNSFQFELPVLHLQRMLTSRPAPLTASRPLHARTPGKALQKARGILQENALQAPRTAKTLTVQLQTPLKGKYSITK
jgi:hypothetical protein